LHLPVIFQETPLLWVMKTAIHWSWRDYSSSSHGLPDKSPSQNLIRYEQINGATHSAWSPMRFPNGCCTEEQINVLLSWVQKCQRTDETPTESDKDRKFVWCVCVHGYSNIPLICVHSLAEFSLLLQPAVQLKEPPCYSCQSPNLHCQQARMAVHRQ
jgi:hypothetical protein